MFIILSVVPSQFGLSSRFPAPHNLTWPCTSPPTAACPSPASPLALQPYVSLSKKLTPNFQARYLNGNIKRGVYNVHINLRSLYNKMSEVKNLIKKEKPHILGVSEAELKKSLHNPSSLKVPGYDLLLPKSWSEHGKARIVMYVKKNLAYEHVEELENPDIQSIWIKAGFKNNKKVYYSHVYREHTSTLGSSISSQRSALATMLGQWEDALVHGDQDTVNEVHIAGDMNLDSLEGRWQESDYSLVTLARMVIDFCNLNSFTQVVDKVTRVQYNSVKNKTLASCIDHVYCNARHRISPISIITCGTSDHDAIAYTRYAKEPKPPSRTIRKRSYKNFKKGDYLEDLAKLDFRDIYSSNDVDEAAAMLTAKLVSVLDLHAPWVIYQQRKHFVPWITPETIRLMEERDNFKKEAKGLALLEGANVSADQLELWDKYKKLRNKINNRIKQEEVLYKRDKVKQCQECPSKTWGLAKKYMNWESTGPPTQLEVEDDKKISLISKAADLAKVMNQFFINKVQKIVKGLENIPMDFRGCKHMMQGKNISLSLNHVTVHQVRKLLVSLKSKTCTSVDHLDNYSVKLAADFIAGPLHHVITLSLMQQRFPSSWKYTKIVPLHKKKSPLKPENYRPVAILSPLSKILEKVIFKQIYSYFERNQLFHPSLHGYRGGRSTMTALLSMYDKWVTAAKDGQVSGVVLVDLSAAFDLVSPDLLVQKLEIYGFDKDTTAWILSYLTDRYQTVWIDHVYSELIESSIGVPQGSNLGPLFFNIFFNDLPTYIEADIDCYADDSTLGATAGDVADIGMKLTSDCSRLTQWMNGNKFKLNTSKTHLMVMGTAARLRNVNDLHVNMNGEILEKSEGHKELLLGVVVQCDLKWSLQIKNLVDKLKKRLTGLEKLKHFMNRSEKDNIVRGIFNSVLCYCLPLFGGCSTSEKNDLQTLQNRAARLVLNFPPRSNRERMFIKLKWLSVRQLIAYHTLISVYKVRVDQVPENLARIICRDNHNGFIIVKNTRLQLYRDSFVFRGSLLWNKLPRDVRNEQKLSKFKIRAKEWVLQMIPRFDD